MDLWAWHPVHASALAKPLFRSPAAVGSVRSRPRFFVLVDRRAKTCGVPSAATYATTSGPYWTSYLFSVSARRSLSTLPLTQPLIADPEICPTSYEHVLTPRRKWPRHEPALDWQLKDAIVSGTPCDSAHLKPALRDGTPTTPSRLTRRIRMRPRPPPCGSSTTTSTLRVSPNSSGSGLPRR